MAELKDILVQQAIINTLKNSALVQAEFNSIECGVEDDLNEVADHELPAIRLAWTEETSEITTANSSYGDEAVDCPWIIVALFKGNSKQEIEERVLRGKTAIRRAINADWQLGGVVEFAYIGQASRDRAPGGGYYDQVTMPLTTVYARNIRTGE